jgi:hypothetical protein
MSPRTVDECCGTLLKNIRSQLRVELLARQRSVLLEE